MRGAILAVGVQLMSAGNSSCCVQRKPTAYYFCSQRALRFAKMFSILDYTMHTLNSMTYVLHIIN